MESYESIPSPEQERISYDQPQEVSIPVPSVEPVRPNLELISQDNANQAEQVSKAGDSINSTDQKRLSVLVQANELTEDAVHQLSVEFVQKAA